MIQCVTQVPTHFLKRRHATRCGNTFGAFVGAAIRAGSRTRAAITRRGARILLGTRWTLGDGLVVTAARTGRAT